MNELSEIYNLKNDLNRIKLVQESSLQKSLSIGLKTENDVLFGTAKWFNAIENGEIISQTISGLISKVYMAGHNDFPEFEVDSKGNKTNWALEGNLDNYVVGRKIELTFVIQKFKRGTSTNCVIKICIAIDT